MSPPPLVLVHGLLDTPAVFTPLKRELAGRRHPLLIPALPLRLGRTPTMEAAELLGSHIEAAFGPHQPIDLLGFSMGGVIGRCWLQLLGGLGRTRRFFSVGSPQQGTLTARPWPSRVFRGIADLRNGSALLERLNGDLDGLRRIECHSAARVAGRAAGGGPHDAAGAHPSPAAARSGRHCPVGAGVAAALNSCRQGLLAWPDPVERSH
jgi:triacylglycerol lipase